MPDWNPDLYHRFRQYRQEPFHWILARLPLSPDERIIDLGCGTGENTIELARRSSNSVVTGIDSSPAMLARARELRAALPPELRDRISFTHADFRELAAIRAYSVIFSNAALQWASDHRDILRRCFNALSPGGRLVIQMPSNHHETAQTTLTTLAAESPWSDLLGGLTTPSHTVLEPDEYAKILAILGFDQIDCYYHTFQHSMENPAAIVEFCRATTLRPFLDKLPSARALPFIDAFTRRLEAAYNTTGTLTFTFRRIFLGARRPG